LNGTVLNNSLAVNAALIQLAPQPAGKPAGTATTTSTPTAPVTTKAIDAAFAGIGSTSPTVKKTVKK
jgi:hypothetical protein